MANVTTIRMPNLFIAFPTSNMQHASEICDNEKSNVPFDAMKFPAYSGIPMK